MTYIIIGIVAIVVIGGISYLIYRRRVARLPEVSEEKAPEVNPELPETAPEVDSAEIAEPPETVAEVKVAPPMVAELSSLPEDAKNKLMNAVWYRCENPYCNYTQFLDVHHLVSEAEGGTNKLDNLLVLCSKCHAAADNHEIPEEELRSWIKERTERFKTDLDWPYK
jgi:hypothetical protein